jgi:hypothetical protein
MVGGDDGKASIVGKPSKGRKREIWRSECAFGFVGEVEEPQAGVLFVFVLDASVVFVFFLPFFYIGFGVGSEKGDSLAVAGPIEAANATFASGESSGLATVHRQKKNLLLAIAVGEESERFSIWRPLGRGFGFIGVGELAKAARSCFEKPDVAGALIGRGRFADDESNARAVGKRIRGQRGGEG